MKDDYSFLQEILSGGVTTTGGADKTWTFVCGHDFTIPRYYLDGHRQFMQLQCWICFAIADGVYDVSRNAWRTRLLRDMRHANT